MTLCPAHPNPSPDGISALVEEPPRDGERKNGERQVELDDGPDPETADRRCSLHERHVVELIGDPDQVAAGVDARDEEYGLAQGGLVSERETRE